MYTTDEPCKPLSLMGNPSGRVGTASGPMYTCRSCRETPAAVTLTAMVTESPAVVMLTGPRRLLGSNCPHPYH